MGPVDSSGVVVQVVGRKPARSSIVDASRESPVRRNRRRAEGSECTFLLITWMLSRRWVHGVSQKNPVEEGREP